MMKKLLIVLCLLLLVGCGGSKDDDPFSHVSKSKATLTNEYPGGLYYSQLSDNEKTLYDNILVMASNFNTSVNCEGISVDELARTVYAFNNEHPEYFFVSLDLGYEMIGDYVSRVDFKYQETDGMSIADTYEYIDNYCEEVLGKISDTSGLERIKAIHDYVCENTVYDTSVLYDQDIRSIVLESKSVCTGYVKLVQLLLQKSGINAYEVQGIAFNDDTSEKHAFNLVEYDGNYYWLDATLDDLEDSYDYKYFMVTDNELFEDHAIGDNYNFNYPGVE